MLKADELSALMSAKLKKGVFTNSSMTAAEYLEDDPSLEAAASDGALLIFRHRPDFMLMNYYVQQDCQCIVIPESSSDTLVCETAFRPKDEAAASRAMTLLADAGFKSALERIRLSRSECRRSDAGEASVEDNDTCGFLPSAAVFLRENFNPLTGCIPPENVLSKDKFAIVRRRGEIAGMLHFSVGRSFWEIRHLAVAPDLRGMGLAAQLLAAAQDEADRISQHDTANAHLRCRVWTGADNLPAIKFYEKHGFTADAYRSKVLIRNNR